MKKIEKLILMSSALLMSAGAWAQEFGDFGGFEDAGSDGASSKLEVSGNAELDLRAYVDADEAKAEKVEIKAAPSVNLGLKYNGNKSDVEINLKVDEDTIKNHPVDVIDEAVLRAYFGSLTLEAGKMKVVWGKGDKLHVLDNFNADDYSDFIIPDYIDRRVSTPMVRAVYSLPVANMNIEGVYTPLLPADRFATKGRWTPAQVTGLTGFVTASATGKVSDAFTAYTKASGTATAAGISYQQAAQAYQTSPSATTQAAFLTAKAAYEAAQTNLKNTGTVYMLSLANANSLSANPDVIYPDLWTLKYGQFGGRATWTLGQVDMGVSYYNGWYKQPSVNYSKLDTFVTKYLASGNVTEADKFLAYDKKQTFGLEASSIIWHFNVRGEVAYNLTEDTAGDDPWVHNNSIGWLGGFDIDLPFWNANLNVQETGTFILKGSECDKNTKDVDYGVNGYTNNKIVCNFTTSFMNDKLAPEVTVMYGIENKDLVIMPKVAFKADQNLTFNASGMIINCGDDYSEFKAWEKNSFVSLGAKYQF